MWELSDTSEFFVYLLVAVGPTAIALLRNKEQM